MRKRRATPPSSLDLFLDTICNAFGGIVFLSILVALSIQSQNRPEVVEPDAAIDSPISSTDLEERVRELQSKRDRLSQLRNKATEFLNEEDAKTLLATKTQLETVTGQNDREIQKQLVLARSIESLKNEQATTLAKADALKKEIEVWNEKKSAVAKQLKSDLTSKQTELNVPSVRTTSKSTLLMAMRYGRVYAISSSSDPTGFHSEHVTTRESLRQRMVTPRQDAGWHLDNAVDLAAIKKLLKSEPADATVISCGVWSDSFAEFAKFKELMIENSFEYQLLPIENDPWIVIGRGGPPEVQ